MGWDRPLNRSIQSIKGLVALVLLGVLLACSAAPTLETPIAPPSEALAPVAPSVPQRPSPPTVQPDRLWQDVTALAGERFSSRDRAQARTYLRERLAAAGWTPTTQAPQPDLVNVVATRPGTAPQAGKLLVVAHYDTVPGSPGADDNASAVATVLELARLFREPTPRTLELVLFDREERGLQGSLAYVAALENPAQVAGVVNLEMLGYACDQPGCQAYPEGIPVPVRRDRGDFLAVVGDQEHLPLLQAFQSPQAAPLPVITVPIPLKGLLTPDVLRSDHAPFWAQNIGAVMVTDTANFRNPHYHQPSDTPATLDRDFLARSAQQVANALTPLLHQTGSLATPGRPAAP